MNHCVFLLYSRLPFELKPLLGSSDSNQPQVKSEAFYKKKVGESPVIGKPIPSQLLEFAQH